MTYIFRAAPIAPGSRRKLMLGAEQSAQGCGCATQLFIAGQTIGTEAEPLPPCIANNALTLQSWQETPSPLRGGWQEKLHGPGRRPSPCLHRHR